MKKIEALFLSDIHLGIKGSNAEGVLNTLKQYSPKYLFLVGDIIDGWMLKRKFRWSQSHTNVIRKILSYSKNGTKVIYIPGNHDEFMRDFCDFEFGHIILARESIHVGIDSKLYLITHGDQFDAVISHAKWLSKVGSWAYDVSIVINRYLNKIRKLLGMPYWSLSSYLKQTVKESVNFIGDYETTLSNYVKSKKLDGIICGHIHHVKISDIGGIRYMNCGDWVESCTALVEHHDGSFEIIDWKKNERNNFSSTDVKIVE